MSDLVVGIDASTTSVKAIAFDRQGREQFQARESYPLSNPAPGHFEHDPEHWWAALITTLKRVTDAVGGQRIAALAIAHQRESFTLIDQDGKALIPAILWLDERARPQVARLAAELGRDTLLTLSGKPPDPTPAIYAVAWLAEHRPEVLKRAAAIVDVNAFLVHRLTGRLATSTASADPLGLLSTADGTWSETLCTAAGLRMDQLPELDQPGAVSGHLVDAVAAVTGLPPSLPIVAGAGDGQAMGLGMAVVERGKAYLSLGSGVVSGTFAEQYITSDAFRTLTAPSGGFMLETVLRSGMQLMEWVMRTTGAAAVSDMEDAARQVPAGSGNLLLLPYWAGVMSPYWDEAARGAIVGLSLHHRPAHLYRAAMEGIAFEQAIATEAMEAGMGYQATSMVAAGGGTQSRLLMEIMATVLERPLAVSPVNEAGALGAAMLAASAVGWCPDRADASRAMAERPVRRIDPVSGLVETYRDRKAIYKDLYGATRDVHRRLAALT
jgi:xylulokinase